MDVLRSLFEGFWDLESKRGWRYVLKFARMEGDLGGQWKGAFFPISFSIKSFKRCKSECAKLLKGQSGF